MKLIKQNDNAGGLIFKQNQNGKAMKQNYNFGRGFTQSSNIYIEVPSLVGTDWSGDFTFLEWHTDGVNGNQTRSGSLSLIKDSLDQNSFCYGYGFNEGGTTITKILNSTVTELSYLSSANKPFNIVKKNNTNIVHGFPALETISTPTLPDLSNLSNIYLGYGYAKGYGYMRNKRPYTLLFKRFLSNDEILYIYNNKLGNDPINVLNLELHLRYDQAEIFDFGGVIGQGIGIRDFSGNNNHARIMNLPAGTLQEQLDYANDNLFETW